MPPQAAPSPPKTIDEQIEELERKLFSPSEKKEDLYTPTPLTAPPPTGTNIPPLGVTRGSGTDATQEYYSLPEKEGAEEKWDKFRKAAAVTKSARSPEILNKEEEKLHDDFLAAYNRNAQRTMLAPGAASTMFRQSGGRVFPRDMPLDELLKETAKTSQGAALQEMRDKISKVRLEKKVGAINIELGESLLTSGERALLSSANAGDKGGMLKGFEGVDLVHHDEELDTYIIKRNGKWGLADEKGASIGDVFDIAGPAVDVALSIFALGTPQR